MSLDLSNTLRIRPNIYVDITDLDFLEQVKSDLKILESKEVGNRLVTRISKGKHAVSIHPGKDSLGKILDELAACTRGKGCSMKISYSLKTTELIDSMGEKDRVPTFLHLAHELIHAYHASNGKLATTERLDTCAKTWWTDREEIHTIKGFPSKNPNRRKPKISENAIREEHGYSERFGHVNAKNVLKMQSAGMQSAFKLNVTAQRVSDVYFRVMRNPHSSPPAVGVHEATEEKSKIAI